MAGLLVAIIRRRVGLGVIGLLVTGLMACGSEPETVAQDESSGQMQDWRTEHTNLTIAMSLPVEVLGMAQEQDRLQDAIAQRVDMPVEIRRVAGYDGVIQAMAADQVDLATFGAGGYASLYDLIGEKAQPVLTIRGHAGDMGYYSSIMVRKESPYQSIEDLEGARIGYVDFNSTSGYIFPRYAMRKQGIDPDTFFGDSGVTGGHMQGVMAIAANQYDAVLALVGGGTPETGFTTGAAMLMAQRGLIDLDDYRFIWYAGPIPNSAFVMRADDRPEFIDLVRGVLAAIPYEDPGALEAYGWRRGTNLTAVSHAFYRPIIEMRAAEISGDTTPQESEQAEEGDGQ